MIWLKNIGIVYSLRFASLFPYTIDINNTIIIFNTTEFALNGMAKIIGQSKVYLNYRISISEIKEVLEVKEGDRVIFVDDKGEIVIRKMKP